MTYKVTGDSMYYNRDFEFYRHTVHTLIVHTVQFIQDSDRILPHPPWRKIDIHDDDALEELIRRSRLEDENGTRRDKVDIEIPDIELPFPLPTKEITPELPVRRDYI